MNIPEKYYMDSQPKPKARTVGDLKRLLKELPNDLEVHVGFADHAELTVFNVGHETPFLELTEPEEEDEDDE